MIRILMIDDDVDGAASLRYYLQENGFWVDVERGALGVAQAASNAYSILILSCLDVMRDICTQASTPILILSDRGDEADRITGLELGADDYVVKPCTARELLARIRAILRRAPTVVRHGAGVNVLTSGRLAMWPERRRAEWLGEGLKLSSTEFSLLEVLLREAGRPVSKLDLSMRALGRPPARHERTIDVHLGRVRRKLGVLSDGRPLIRAVHLHGYQLLKE
ncbi:MAG: chemotaxis protein CheY [Gammaproteobacteria bacterium]|nr:chemotaxis protein CheY [Gammaproteobacteria bacterium]